MAELNSACVVVYIWLVVGKDLTFFIEVYEVNRVYRVYEVYVEDIEYCGKNHL